MSILKELLALREQPEEKFIDRLLDAIDYRDDKDNGFVIDGAERNAAGTKIVFDLEDRDGHRALTYPASLSISQDGKITVECGDESKVLEFDQNQDREDFESDLDDLAFEILEVFGSGVSKMSANDNPDGGDFDDEEDEDN